MYWLLFFVAPPVVFVLPWIVALYRRQFGLFAAILTVWILGWAILLKLWFGVGLAIVILLGLAVVFTTRIRLAQA